MSRRLKILFVLGIVLGAAILIPVIHHYQLRAATEAYIAQLKAQGEPMELAQVIPPPTPPEQNGVPFIAHALTNLPWSGVIWTNPPKAMNMILPGKAETGWQRSNIIELRGIGIPDDTNTWEDLENQLIAAKRDLDSFQNLTNHPILDFSLDYGKGVDLLLPHLGWLKVSAQWLDASALYDLHEGKAKNACTDVRTTLAIAKGETDERILISQLVRIAIAAMNADTTWETLQDPNISDDDLAQLQQDWQPLDFTKPLEKALMFERIEYLQECSQTRESSEKFNKLWGYFYAPDAPVKLDLDQIGGQIRRSLFMRTCDELRWRWFWSYQDEMYGLQSLQVVIDATRMAQTNKSFQAAQSFSEPKLVRLNERHSVNPMNGLRDLFRGDSFFAALRKAMRIETTRNIVVTAIALNRYQRQHRGLPASLDELVPEFLKSVPTDYMDGQPLRYRRNAGGTFLLYSVGENGKDDGGNPALEQGVESLDYYWQSPNVLDWVWPQPATEAEIQNYYANLPK